MLGEMGLLKTTNKPHIGVKKRPHKAILMRKQIWATYIMMGKASSKMQRKHLCTID